MKKNLSILLESSLRENIEEFTPKWQDLNNEHFMDYTNAETGDDIPVYLSEHTESQHVKKRFLERFANPDKIFYDHMIKAEITARDYMSVIHPSKKYKALEWPNDFERFMEMALDRVENNFGWGRQKYIVEFPYYGLLIPFDVYKFNDSRKPFIIVHTVRHALFDSLPDHLKVDHHDTKFFIKSESSLYNKNYSLFEGFNISARRSSAPIITIFEKL